MSKRAEEAALKAYPIDICGYQCGHEIGDSPEPLDYNEDRRKAHQKGYEQAEKDLADVAQFSSGPDGFFYGKGYQQAKKDLGWISVKNRLPEEGHFVFTCSEDEGHPQCVGVSCLLKGQWWDGEGYLNVDYWMEIPKLPKEEQK